VSCLAISSNLFIDSALSRGVGASANASRRGIKPNAKFVIDVRSGSARLVSTRCIRAGDEIFVPYGRDYWHAARSSSHSTDGIPDWEWELSDPFMVSSPVHSPSMDCAVTLVSSPSTTVDLGGVAPVSSPSTTVDCPGSFPLFHLQLLWWFALLVFPLLWWSVLVFLPVV